MKISKWLKAATAQLTAADIPSARLDCLLLLEYCLAIDRLNIIAEPDSELTVSQQKKLDTLLQKRSLHIPIAHLRGKTEFYNRTFLINNAVLEPRPESETMIELVKKLDGISTIIDVGTGSGALGITAYLELATHPKVVAIDIDQRCLEVATKNAALHTVPVQFLCGDLLTVLTSKTLQNCAILANLPYVPDSYEINPAAQHEPHHAIFGGADGLNYYRQLFSQLATMELEHVFVLTEALPFQQHYVAALARDHGFALEASEDFIQVFTRS